MSLAIQAAGKTDVGSVRANNEDNFGFDLERGIFVLCDGMGGAAAGEIASTLGVDTIVGYFRNPKQEPLSEETEPAGASLAVRALGYAIRSANRAIHQEASENQERTGMGTTVVAVYFEGDAFIVGHVGDSRVYLIRSGNARQLTDDHSLVMEQVRRGLLTLDEAKTSRMQNLVTRALGAEQNVEPDLSTYPAASGDVLLLCSDGLCRFVPETKMVEVLSGNGNLQDCCDLLVQSAKEHGSDDNITCLLLRVAEQANR